MGPTAAILHADLDAFYAAVEQRDDPRLYRRPVIVGGGVVLACSYEAKRCGVRSGMGGRQARARCPYAAVVPPRISAYVEASRAVFTVLERHAPVVEAISIDEAFLNVHGQAHINGTPMQIARRIRREVREEVGLPISVGVARTKSLAKMASAAAKPDGLRVVEPDQELAFLHPLPVEAVWGVGRVTAPKLHARGIRTVGELAAVEPEALGRIVGRALGRHLHALANGHDPRPVRARRRRRSIGAQRALGQRHRSEVELAVVLTGLVDRVTRRLRDAGRSCRTVVLRLRFGDFSRATRSRTLLDPTTRTHTILRLATELLGEARPLIVRRGLTLIGVALTNLGEDLGTQLSLVSEPGAGVDQAVDRVRERFGAGAITRGVLVGQDTGVTVPMLADR
ncbi:MAG TPA: DNA polymerase IV [Solirubrobacteraceae bacterium]|nr:DNA polymerase IV [Solirubrobacteraceae bacterium]